MTTMADDQDDLTPEERRALGSLSGEEPPPAALEERVVRALRARGQIRSASLPRTRVLIAGSLAASIAFFAAGLAVGLRWDRAAAPAPGEAAAAGGRPEFVLFLYEDGDYGAPPPDAVAGRVEEYRRWARALRDKGSLIEGQKLKDAGEILSGAGEAASVREGRPQAPEGILAGYFIVAARDAEEALAIARGCPHLKHRGRIAVREIEPT
jgi:hypothetical protein